MLADKRRGGLFSVGPGSMASDSCILSVLMANAGTHPISPVPPAGIYVLDYLHFDITMPYLRSFTSTRAPCSMHACRSNLQPYTKPASVDYVSNYIQVHQSVQRVQRTPVTADL
jgi:hypothetical protein